MKLAIMQPYFFPYIGYFQLINAVDEFVVYDEIEFAKKGWINRNRILVNGKDSYITLPLKKASDYLFINNRYLADTWEKDRVKVLNRIKESYRNAPYFENFYPIVEKCLLYKDYNLFNYIFYSLKNILAYLKVKTPIIKSSDTYVNKDKKGVNKVIAICKARRANIYINPIGGLTLYSKDYFAQYGIALFFLKTTNLKYSQFNNPFIPNLSIIDFLMFNSHQEAKSALDGFTLV